MEQNQKQFRPKPISLTFNPNNSRLIVLCDDGSIWEREVKHGEFGEVSWRWVKSDQFQSTEAPKK